MATLAGPSHCVMLHFSFFQPAVKDGCVPPSDLGLPEIHEPPIPPQKDFIPFFLKGLPPRFVTR